MKENDIIKLIILHLGIGILIAFFPIFSKVYAYLIILVGIYFVVKNKNENNEVLYAMAYVIGSEVFLRATKAPPCHEYGKYFMLLFSCLGFFYSGIPKKMNPYWLFLLFLIPSIFISGQTFDAYMRHKVSFDLLGPFALGICAIYTYQRKISRNQLNAIVMTAGLPIIACCTYLVLLYPYHTGVVNNSESNFYLSGNYGPNQLSTILGLGFFIYFLRILLIPSSKTLFIILLIVFCFIYYRGLMTFSRGGMMSGLMVICVLLVSIYLSREKYHEIKRRLVLLLLLIPTIFILASYQTDALLYRRYVNKNINGLPKTEGAHDRDKLVMDDIKYFEESPILGKGVGEAKEIRSNRYGKTISNHNEITRLLAEHGIFGILSILILVFFPLHLYYKDRQNIYLLSFFAFWLLTVNHSGMRTAAPAFIYALALLIIEKKRR